MFDAQTLAFLAIAATLAMTPGADTLLVIKNTLRSGYAAGWSTTLGIVSGTLSHAILSGVGLSVVLAQSDRVFLVIKALGAGYLVWLGVQALRQAYTTEAVDGPVTQSTLPASFREGLVTNLLNPKVAIFYIAFLPQFISLDDPVFAKSVLLASIHNAMSLVWLALLIWGIRRGSSWFQLPAVRAWLSRLAGGIMVGLGVRLLMESR